MKVCKFCFHELKQVVGTNLYYCPHCGHKVYYDPINEQDIQILTESSILEHAHPDDIPDIEKYLNDTKTILNFRRMLYGGV